MDIVTVQDASQALTQLQIDLSATATDIGNQAVGNTYLPGTSELASTAVSLVQQLENRLQSIALELYATADPEDDLIASQIAEIKQLQQQVISDRALIGKEISSVDWTFGGIFADTGTVLENWGSEAITGVSNALGINWTLVAIAVGAIVVFLVYMKVT